MEKLLITGASGYIGSMLVKHILREDSGMEVTAPLRRAAGTRLPASDRLRIINMDLSEKTALDSLAPDCSYIIHCACATKSSEMAELVAEKHAKGRIKVVCDIPEHNVYGYAPDTGLRLSGRKLMELGWTPAQDLVEMYRDAAEDI